MRFNLSIIIVLFCGLTVLSQNTDRNSVIRLTNLSNIEMNEIVTPNSGSIIFNTDTRTIHYYNGTNWINLITASPPLIMNAYLDFDQFIRNNNITNLRYNTLRTNLGGFPNPLANQNSVTTIPQNGIYEISHTATIDRVLSSNNNANGANSFESNIQLNGTNIPGSRAIVTVENQSYGIIQQNVIIRLNQNDQISVTIQRLTGERNYTILDDGAQLSIKRVD